MNKEEAKAIIQKLVDKYNQIVLSGKNKEYHEERTKSEFIEPMFQALGWDMHTTEREDEVIKEERISNGRVDYAFRINGMLKFFLEAKGMKSTADESKSAEQAINYAYHKKVAWAVVCDFETLKVYNSGWIGDRLDQKRFVSLAASNYIEQFDKLWWLSRESFEKGVLDKEAQILGKMKKSIAIDELLLNDFMVWRKKLSTDIMSHARKDMVNIEKIDDIVQNILDRFIFIRTCEDRGLEEKVLWQALINSKCSRKSLLEHVRGIFRDFDQKYDSRLFVQSESDSVKIGDMILKEIIEGLYGNNRGWVEYNFSFIDADILGNIYEQYLGHILSKTPKKTKLTENGTHRKEQGIYYTPTYIVDYIVKNTLGELLKTKKLEDLPKIKVLDPACGSGSFLIRAFQTLDEEYKKKSNYGTAFRKNQILKDNIFGVDLDAQAVEISQLNLLLRAAEKRMRLPMLQGNIKCGNSLIEDSEVEEERAFNWKDKFPDVLKESGFDVIIGNPPYVRQEELLPIKKNLQANYEVYHSMADLFVYFFERELKLLKEGGYFGMIVSNKWLKAGYGASLRKFLGKYWIEQFIDFGDLKVFQDATTYPCIIIIRNVNKPNPQIKTCVVKTLNFPSIEDYVKKNQFYVDQKGLDVNGWDFQSNEGSSIMKKLRENGIPLKEYVKGDFYRGILTGFNEAFVIGEEKRKELIRQDSKSAEIIKPFLTGKEVRRYGIGQKGKYIILTRIGVEMKRYPAVFSWLSQFKNQLEKRWDKGNYWYELRSCDYYDIFDKPKIIYGKITTQPRFTIDKSGYIINDSNFMIPAVDKKLLAVLNSKLGWFMIMNTCTQVQGGYQLIWKYFGNVPISQKKSDELERLVDKMLSLNERLNRIGDVNTNEQVDIKEEIKNIDKKIDEIVYKLYGITAEEQKIIEESVK